MHAMFLINPRMVEGRDYLIRQVISVFLNTTQPKKTL